MTDQTSDLEEFGPDDEQRVRQISKLEYEEHKQEVSDRLRFQIDIAQALLKALLIVNGAAVISLLTFIGNVSNEIDYELMWWSFASFALGIISVLLAYFGAFFSQMHFMQTAAMQMWASHGISHGIAGVIDEDDFRGHFRKGVIAMNIGIFGAAISVSGFVIGAFLALDAIL